MLDSVSILEVAQMQTGKRKDLGPDGLYGFLKNLLPESKFTIAELTGLANRELLKQNLFDVSTQSVYKVVVRMMGKGLVSVASSSIDKRNRSFVAKFIREAPIGLLVIDKTPPTSENVTKLMAEVGDKIEVETAVAKTTVISKEISERIAALNKMKEELDQLLAGDVISETREKLNQLRSEIEALAELAGAIVCFDCKLKREKMTTDRVMLFNASDRLKAREARLAADALRGGPAAVVHSK
ncbi:MAG: hypothetical protein A2568_02885 [Candidatus Yanofskybacteria bacterium RIFOXYD1_FULL_44_17]|nr:MAG: hypothetical protein A2241_02020 [Candidatus Yanofskybacteria bacterium RIFOXYA2_FULL_45_28]OGN37163.1 MAG: hypothetical protein A2405_03690 [Candidatus Yanofskybacteria bacterium RIFOXYC1_FULL_44_16]OGN37631.1 MAG: hypothetical protein A2371_00765 [Candidatus Yanofskybacteria bacterium RIFOXYB1_FULL_44_29]OGN37757.1 MAG: hypothetical protein A2302_02070 [Candidatus Yanofskybacteria bacterium RIFOXYB2_FULL_44_18]OGN39451.1 MAG: hypothetical protein A2568_02885 [Candidatus Yanofskybacter